MGGVGDGGIGSKVGGGVFDEEVGVFDGLGGEGWGDGKWEMGDGGWGDGKWRGVGF